MPINIYRNDDSDEQIACLANNEWELPAQLWELEKWLNQSRDTLTPGNIIADIGFSVREEAAGGGAVLSAESMKHFSDVGIDIYFSEYPGEHSPNSDDQISINSEQKSAPNP